MSLEELYCHTKVLKTCEIYDLQKLIFIYKINNQISNQFTKFLTMRESVSSRVTRNSTTYYLPSFRLSISHASFLYKAPQLWSNLPEAIKTLLSLLNIYFKQLHCSSLSGLLTPPEITSFDLS